jgi:hypothetical protein
VNTYTLELIGWIAACVVFAGAIELATWIGGLK